MAQTRPESEAKRIFETWLRQKFAGTFTYVNAYRHEEGWTIIVSGVAPTGNATFTLDDTNNQCDDPLDVLKEE